MAQSDWLIWQLSHLYWAPLPQPPSFTHHTTPTDLYLATCAKSLDVEPHSQALVLEVEKSQEAGNKAAGVAVKVYDTLFLHRVVAQSSFGCGWTKVSPPSFDA